MATYWTPLPERVNRMLISVRGYGADPTPEAVEALCVEVRRTHDPRAVAKVVSNRFPQSGRVQDFQWRVLEAVVSNPHTDEETLTEVGTSGPLPEVLLEHLLAHPNRTRRVVSHLLAEEAYGVNVSRGARTIPWEVLRRADPEATRVAERLRELGWGTGRSFTLACALLADAEVDDETFEIFTSLTRKWSGTLPEALEAAQRLRSQER